MRFVLRAMEEFRNVISIAPAPLQELKDKRAFDVAHDSNRRIHLLLKTWSQTVSWVQASTCSVV